MNLSAIQIFDSRGSPTVEVSLSTSSGTFVASVPSGASTGSHEAFELRDQIPSEYNGKGVSKAVSIINNQILPLLIEGGFDLSCQEAVDAFLISLDGTKDKSRLGANSILAVSMAVARAGAHSSGLPLYKHIARLAGNEDRLVLPVPFFNVINGGVHAPNPLSFQEFMVVPTGQTTFKDRMRVGVEIYQALGDILRKEGHGTTIGDEGGYSPSISSAEEAISLLDRAISVSSHNALIALDVAASELYKDGKYMAEGLGACSMIRMYKELALKYPRMFSIEDPFEQDDWDAWSRLCRELPSIQIVGDDLTVTSIERIKRAHDFKACNALLLKINQIGTVSEAIKAAKLARCNGWKVIVSHRSGETEDTFIADLAVGIGAEFIKSGAPCRTERLCKYNRLLRIEKELE